MRNKIYAIVFWMGMLLLKSGMSFGQALDWTWAKGIVAKHQIKSNSISVDAVGNIYTTGYFSDTADFDPGPNVFNLISVPGSLDAFVCKLDASGNFIWAKGMGGISGDAQGYSITVDDSNNVYTTGTFDNTIDFDPGSGIYNLNASSLSINMFVSKLDSNGNFIWARGMGGTVYTDSYSIAVDLSGNVYTTGSFYGYVDFDPGSGTYTLGTPQGANYSFISKLNSNGNFVWAKAISGNGDASSYSIALDSSKNVFITGLFSHTIDFDPDSSVTYNLTSHGGDDVFIAKYDSTGDFLWSKYIGGLNDDSGNSIAVDKSGNIYTTGYFDGIVDFNPDTSVVFNLNNPNYGNVFISKLDNSGNFIWAKRIGGQAGSSFRCSLAVDTEGSVYTTGRFDSPICDFDPDSSGVFNLPNVGYSDIFVCKLDSSGNFVWAQAAGGVGYEFGRSIAIDSSKNVYLIGGTSSTNTYSFGSTTLSDKIFIAKLSCVTSSIVNAVACNSYTSPSGNYVWTNSGTYMDTIPNGPGCYNAVTVNLIINTINTTSTQTITACDSYTSPSGNHYWTSSGIYADTIPNAGGCDSILSINLTINTVNNAVTQNGLTLTANAMGAKYQWLDCNNGFSPISNDTNQAFTATVNGNYAVAILHNGCIDTSACYAITNVSINEIGSTNNFSVFPDPVKNSCSIIAPNFTNATLFLYDITGRVLLQQPFNAKATIDISKLSKGIYIAEIKDKQGRNVKGKVVKE